VLFRSLPPIPAFSSHAPSTTRAIVLARIARVVLGAWDEKAGMGGSVGDVLRHPRLNHRPEVAGGVLEAESSVLLREFFAERRRAGFVDTPPAAG